MSSVHLHPRLSDTLNFDLVIKLQSQHVFLLNFRIRCCQESSFDLHLVHLADAFVQSNSYIRTWMAGAAMQGADQHIRSSLGFH